MEALFVLHGAFRLSALNYDPWQAQHLASRLQAGGLGTFDNRHQAATRVPMVEISQTGGNLQLMASRLIEAFNDHRVELYPCDDLRRDLKRFRVEERSYGFRLVSPHDEYGHGDLGSAFTLAMLAATELAAKRIVHAGFINPSQEEPARLRIEYDEDAGEENDNKERGHRASADQNDEQTAALLDNSRFDEDDILPMQTINWKAVRAAASSTGKSKRTENRRQSGGRIVDTGIYADRDMLPLPRLEW